MNTKHVTTTLIALAMTAACGTAAAEPAAVADEPAPTTTTVDTPDVDTPDVDSTVDDTSVDDSDEVGHDDMSGEMSHTSGEMSHEPSSDADLAAAPVPVCTEPDVAPELPAADLAAVVEGLVQDHVTRTQELVVAAGEHGLDSSEVEAALAALDDNGLELGGAVALVYGEGAGDAFVALWRTHLQLFVDFAVGVASDDQTAQRTADAGLRQYSIEFAAFFDAATGGLMPTGPTIETFEGHVDTVEALIVDVLTGADSADDSGHDAHDHVRELSSMISTAVAAQFPCRFPTDA